MVDDDSSQGIRIGSRWPQTEVLMSEGPEGERGEDARGRRPAAGRGCRGVRAGRRTGSRMARSSRRRRGSLQSARAGSGEAGHQRSGRRAGVFERANGHAPEAAAHTYVVRATEVASAGPAFVTSREHHVCKLCPLLAVVGGALYGTDCSCSVPRPAQRLESIGQRARPLGPAVMVRTTRAREYWG